MQSILLLDDQRLGHRRMNAIVKDVNQMLKSFCINEGIVYLDVNAVLSRNGVLQPDDTPDGIHISWLGYQACGEAVEGVLDQIEKKRSPDAEDAGF